MWSRTIQSVNEKIGGAEATKLTEDYRDAEKKVDLTNDLIEDLANKTKEYLQPNPANRAKLMAAKKISKFSGQQKAHSYPQPEGILGETLFKYAHKMECDAPLAKALIEAGDAMKLMAEAKYSLESDIKQNFLQPLSDFQTKDLKTVNHMRKEVQARRLDFDSKRRKTVKSSMGYNNTEVEIAQDRFVNAVNETQVKMDDVLQRDVEQIAQLHAFAQDLFHYHKNCMDIMQSLTEKLENLKHEVANRPKKEHVTASPTDFGLSPIPAGASGYNPERTSGFTASQRNSFSTRHMPNSFSYSQSSGDLLSFDQPPSYSERDPGTFGSQTSLRSTQLQSYCKALYDFEKEKDMDLPFKEGDIIILNRMVDENWYEGSLNGTTGLVPINYVKVMVPLPQ